eukprot:358841_1
MSLAKTFSFFPLSGSPSQTWLVLQGTIYFIFGLLVVLYPDVLDVFNHSHSFYHFDYQLAQMIFSIVLIMGLCSIGNGSDAFFNREVIPIVLPEMQNLPHSHSLLS